MNTKELIFNFFNDYVGISESLTHILFESNLKKIHSKDFEHLSDSEKVNFGQELIDGIFSKYLDDAKVQNLKVVYLFKFSLNESIKKIEQIFSKKANFSVGAIININLISLPDLILEAKNPEVYPFTFELSNLIDGIFFLLLPVTDANKLANSLMSSAMMDIEENSLYGELSQMKASSIFEFINILMPSFSNVLSLIYDDELYFTPLMKEDFLKKKINTQDADSFKVEKIIKTNLVIKIDDDEFIGNAYFLLKKSKQAFNKLMNKEQKDIFDEKPPKYVLKKTKDITKDLEKLFALLNISKSDSEYLIERLTNKKLNDVEIMSFDDFLISNYCPTSSDNKKENIKINLSYILGLDDRDDDDDD